MRNGSNYLQYNLYKDAAYAQVWGDGTGGTVTLANTNSGSGTGPTHTIYGRIPAGQDLPVGTYTDSIVITITF
jgi:spore coat protein U-like protein